MMNSNPFEKTKKWFYYVSIGTILIIVYKFFDNFSVVGDWFKNLIKILSPFLIGILIAYMLYLPIDKLEKTFKKKKIKKARALSIAIVYFAVILFLYLIIKIVLPTMYISVRDLASNIQVYYNDIINDEYSALIPGQENILYNVIKPLVDYIKTFDFTKIITIEKIQNYIGQAVNFAKVIFNIVVAFICSVYILTERENIVEFLKKIVFVSRSEKEYEKFNKYFANGNEIFFKFISSQLIDALVVATLMCITLSILRVKYAILLGVLIGLFNLIPYFGAIISIVIAGALTLLTGGWKQALLMLIISTIVQQIDANIINPKITGSRLNTSPLLVIFAVTIGGAYFGVLGMFLGVPVVVLIKSIIHDNIEEKTKQKMKLNEIKHNNQSKEVEK